MKKAKFFDRRIGKISALTLKLEQRAGKLPEAHKRLFTGALEELRTSLEELQIAGEELSQQSEELSSARLAAEEDRRRYLELFAYAPDAYLVTDPMGIIIEANERAGALFKASPGSLIGKSMVLFIAKADRKAFFARLTRLSDSGGLGNWEIYFRARKGKSFPAHVDITAVRGPKGRLFGFRWLIRDATETKKQEMIARLATFPELNPEPVSEVDAAGHVYYMNPAARRAFRGLPEEGAGHPWLAGLEKDATRPEGSRKRSFSREVQVDGRWFLQTVSPVRDTGRFRIYGRDITERKRMEEALIVAKAELEERVRDRTAELARSTELLERVFASVDLSIAYLDRDLRFIRVNRAFADAFGGTSESYAGRDYSAVFPRAETEVIFRKVLDTGQPYVALESPFPRLHASRPAASYWDWSLQPVITEKGREGIVLSMVNVTGRLKAEEERRRLSTAVEQSSEAIAITDPEDRILYVNQTFQTLHGLSRRRVLGRTYGEILGLDKEEESLKQGIRAALTRGEVWKGRLTRAIGGQAERKLYVTISPIRDDSGRLVNFAILERDVTSEHNLETYVRRLQKMDALGTLAGGIAHDFNNILVPILINAEVASLDAAKDGPAASYLNLIIEAANRGRELVKRIISFSRPQEQPRSLVDMSGVVKEAVKFLQSSTPKSIAIRERIEPFLSMVRADPTQIHQVIMNLGSNAAHAMREKGGWLDIGLSGVVIGSETPALNPDLKPGPYVQLTVEDSGGGMTREVQERVFDPFFTTKPPGEGAGMGLTVVQGIVKSHGGAITVSSRPGRGTRFDVYIPAKKGDAKAAAPEEAPARTGKGHILFVDDEDMLVRTVPCMLERLGYTTEAVSDPAEALALFRENPGAFDLVITDVTMPGMTGEKLAREMLRIRPGIPIILSTGFNESVREDEVRAMGIREFIMKPYSTGEMAERIQAALKRPE